MTVGSLFTGIGGLDLGFERAGFHVRWMVEANPFCRDVLAQRWPGVPCYEDARMSIAQWRRVEPVDVIIGGFPCQDVSDAGMRTGLTGARSGLWWCLRRAARVVGPSFLVVENVPGLFARGFDTVLGSLARLRFDAEWATIRASDVQAPHRRKRVFIVAYPDGSGFSEQRERRLLDRQRAAFGHDVDGRDPVVADTSGTGSQGGGSDQPSRWRESAALRADRCADAWPGWPARPGEPQHDWEPPRCLPSQRRAVADTAGVSSPRRHRETDLVAAGSVRARGGAGQGDEGREAHGATSRAQSALGDRFDGLPADVAGWRRAALQAAGNAVVPQCAEIVARRVIEITAERREATA